VPYWRADEELWQTDGEVWSTLVSGELATPTDLTAVNVQATGAVQVSWSGSAPSYRLLRERWTGGGTPPGGS
jgi:hypothetical protein